MSLPVVLPGSCCPVTGASQLAEPSYRNRPRGLSASSQIAGGSRLLLPGRPLLSLGLLQLLLGGSMVALSFGALSLSNSPPIRNSCPFWAGSSVILSGIIGLTTWRRPMLLLLQERERCVFKQLKEWSDWCSSTPLSPRMQNQGALNEGKGQKGKTARRGKTTPHISFRRKVNVFVLLSVVCVLLNLAGFILCCQGAQLVSSMTSCQLSEAGDVCYCCPLSPSTQCPEEKMLELHPAHSCGTMKILLKKVLFALCALNALTTVVCLMAAALRYLQIFTARTPCMDEVGATMEEEPALVPDPDEFVAPAPPPSYFSTFYSYTPCLARRILRDNVIPLPHIYGARMKGVEVFCPLDFPPPYEAVSGSSTNAVTQDSEIALTEVSMNPTMSPPGASLRDMSPQTVPASPGVLPQAKPQPQPQPPPQQHAPAPIPWRRARIDRSNSDPVLMDISAKVRSSCDASLTSSPQTTDSSTQTSQPTLAAHTQGQVTMRRSANNGRVSCRPRPSSMVDYQSYRHTQQLVRKILEQPAAQGLAPEVQELVDSIRNVLLSDQEHMEEAVRCASYIEQVFTDSMVGPSQPKPPKQQPAGSSSQTFPRPPRRRPGLLHLRSCGDLSSFTCTALESLEHRGSSRKVRSIVGPRAGSRTGSRPDHPERPHSLIGVFRETVL